MLERLQAQYDVTGKVIIEDGRATTRLSPRKLVSGFELVAMIASQQERIANDQKILAGLIAVLEGEPEAP